MDFVSVSEQSVWFACCVCNCVYLGFSVCLPRLCLLLMEEVLLASAGEELPLRPTTQDNVRTTESQSFISYN